MPVVIAEEGDEDEQYSTTLLSSLLQFSIFLCFAVMQFSASVNSNFIMV